MRVRTFWRAVALVAGVSLAATPASAIAAPAAAAVTRPAPQKERSVPGKPVPALPVPVSETDTKAISAPPQVSWPAKGTADVELPAGRTTPLGNPGPSTVDYRRAGDLPVAIGVLPAQASARSAPADPGKVRVEVLDRAEAVKAGVPGVLLKVTDAGGTAGRDLSVRLDYRGFAEAYGGNYGSRLRLVQYPECVLSTPARAECRTGTPLRGDNHAKDRLLSGAVTLAAPSSPGRAAVGTNAVLAAEPGAGSNGGSYQATDLAASASWQAGGSSGDFSYSIPVKVPPSLGGPAPSVGLSYSSGSADGRTSATNNQASTVGDGWDLSAGGYVERKYRSCPEDKDKNGVKGNQGDRRTGDQCYDTDNATLMLGGTSAELVWDAPNKRWRSKKDDGSYIELLKGADNGDNDGEHWKVTSTDGTQYFLGRNKLPGWDGAKRHPTTNSAWTVPVFGNHPGEPCYKPEYAAAWCQQAWRWNLDQVIDPKGNITVYYYNYEENHYGRNATPEAGTFYVRAGHIDRIEYGLREDNAYAAAPSKVRFETAERCLPSGAITCEPGQLNKDTAKSWPDVPFDQICAPNTRCESQLSPVFFTRKRLTKVVTEVLREVPNAQPRHFEVDSWSLRHIFPEPGDGLSPSLWLAGATRSGHVGGTASLPEITFGGTSMPNRVGTIDRLTSVTRYRLTGIRVEGGGNTTVTYSKPECGKGDPLPAPEANTLRCYPTWWSPEGAPEPLLDWFHKYVVTDVLEGDYIGGSSVLKTEYQYPAKGGAWHFDDNDFGKPEHRTYSAWRGFQNVRVIKGDTGTVQSMTDTVYLRGMDEDRLPGGRKRDVWVTPGKGTAVEDHEALQGFVLESLEHNGGKVVSASVNRPWLKGPTATSGDDRSYLVQTAEVRGRALIAGDKWRETLVSKTFDEEFGTPLTVDDAGDLAVTGDEKCTQNTYLRNRDRWLLTYSARVLTVAVPCAAAPGKDSDRISDVRSAYDHQEAGKAPTGRGEVTKVERWNGTGYQPVSESRFDPYGRTIETTDVDKKKSSTAYSPAAGLPVRTITTTNQVQHTSVKTLEPAWAIPVAETGPNGERADLAYDPLGRMSKVWPPHKPKVNEATPASTEYSYEYRPGKPTAVTTKSLQEKGGHTISVTLYDGMLRPRQTQAPSVSGGRVLSDTWYDSRGLAWKTNGAYYNQDSGPTTELLGVLDTDVPNQSVTHYDGMARSLEVIQLKGTRQDQVEQRRTSSRYEGDRTHVLPPTGDTVTSVISNAQGQVVERRQYHGQIPDGPFDATTYSYTKAGQLETVKDPMGNTWRYEYDALGRKFKDHDPDKGTTTYAFNDTDQLTSTTDSRGRTVAYSYDVLGRKDGMYEGSVGGKKLAEWTFDTLKKGLPTASTRFVDGQAYTSKVDWYDGANRPTKTSVVIPAREGGLAATYTFSAKYSANTGLLEQSSMPAAGGLPAETIAHDYNALGMPIKTFGIQTYADEHKYSPYGETMGLTYGSGGSKVWTDNFYEEGSRRAERTVITSGSAETARVADRNYSYDRAGNINRIADTPEGGPQDVQCFRYDYLRRMTTAFTPSTGDCQMPLEQKNIGGAAPYWYDFTFDKIGNRKTEVKHAPQGNTTRTYHYPAPGPGASQPHTVRSVEQEGPGGTRKDEFGYDATGNTTSRKVTGSTQTLDWDAEGKLSTVTEADGKKSQYVYDAGGGRLLRKENGRTTLYLPGMELTMPDGGQPTAKRYYAHGGATVAVRGSVSGLNMTFGDHQGSPTTSINAASGAVDRRYQDPFGQTRAPLADSWPDDKGFVGGVNDSSGLTHIGARQYDGTTGRFISADPIMDLADPQQINGYSYSNGNPITFSDSTGLAMDCRPTCIYEGENFNRVTPPGWSREQRVRDENARIARVKAKTDEKNAKNARQAKARQQAGVSQEEYEEAKRLAAKRVIDIVLDAAGEILKDITGLNDMEDCFVKGDFWGCASLASNLIPAAKLFTGLAKLYDGIRRAISAVSTYFEKIGPAKALLAKVDKVADDLKTDGGSCPTRSFVPGTRVLLADGSSKPIEEIRIGDRVQAADPETGESGARAVVGTVTNESVKRLVTVTVDTDGDRGEATGSVVATDNHPFWVDNQGRWVYAGELAPGDEVLDSAGARVTVVAASQRVARQRVHNLSVDVSRTYYALAGGTPVLVHNCGPELGDGAPQPGNVAVVGRLDDTAAARGWEGHDVLNIPNWTIGKNDAWVKAVVKNKQDVYVASPLTHRNLWDAGNNRQTVLARELKMLTDSGYKWDGNYMRPPGS
ncbi:polymorphic toxin-type HINT domain-containing protein [Crossiella sp. CA198]|uniref:polymorphic toxin-type HINT domain-containing protein n=1 Tax=Crossiella sp. CA198 TaxID=3455607 RepID=UPI003F8D1399